MVHERLKNKFRIFF